MNNRQKAKRFKRLYETSLPQRTFPVIASNKPLQKYKCRVQVADHTREYAIDEITMHFKRDIAAQYVIYNEAAGCYEITLWVKG